MRLLYSLLTYPAAAVAFAAVLWRGRVDRGYWNGLGERFGFGAALGGGPSIWLHAVSLGEVAAAAVVVRALRARHPRTPFVLTTATPTGRARAQALFGDAVDVRYAPYDTPDSVARFIARVRPRLAIVMETELWPNLFRETERRGALLVLASARLSQRSVSRYRRFGALFRGLFRGRLIVAAQSAEDAARFIAIGADPGRTHVMGNAKFDIDVGAGVAARGAAYRAALFGPRPVWIAGSTHAGEEEQVLDAHARVCGRYPDALLLLAPRHPNRFEGVAQLLARRGVRFVRRSAGIAVPSEAPVLLLDTLGELLDFYASADVAFVGGSLVPVGGHNLLEPAALGLPVLTGPAQFNGREIAQLLLRLGAAREVGNAAALAAAVELLFEDPAARRAAGAAARGVVDANRGSVARLIDLIEPPAAASPSARS
jgi:3-deoxy-D-manno-octulosonic-acid transferase